MTDVSSCINCRLPPQACDAPKKYGCPLFLSQSKAARQQRAENELKRTLPIYQAQNPGRELTRIAAMEAYAEAVSIRRISNES